MHAAAGSQAQVVRSGMRCVCRMPRRCVVPSLRASVCARISSIFFTHNGASTTKSSAPRRAHLCPFPLKARSH